MTQEIAQTTAASGPGKKRNLNRKQRYDAICGWLCLSPAILGFLLFTVVPVALSFFYCFTEYNMLSSPVFVGFRNFATMWKVPNFGRAIGNTMIFATITVLMNLILSFFLAYLLNIKLRGMRVFRTLFYVPCIIPGVAGAFTYGNMFDASTGYINQILRMLGLPTSTFLTDPATALPTIIIMGLWGMGGPMLIWLAGFKSISNTFYEAAKIDGSRWYHDLFYITIPLSTPMIFYNLITNVIGGLQTFASVYLLTNGGPQGSTVTIVMLIYNQGIGYHQMGIACAMAWFLFLITLVMTLISFQAKRFVYSEGELK